MAGPYIAPGASYYLPPDEQARVGRAGQGAPMGLPNINVGAYGYGRGAPATDATRAIQPSQQTQAQPQPFNLQLAPPPAPPQLPPLSINVAGAQRTGSPAARAAAPTAPVDEFTPPKGIPANAIPVLRNGELSYDIPGTGQRLYPTLGGGASEYSPAERLDLARYIEPARIGAEASVRGAGIRAGADVQSARLAQEGAKFRTLAELGATPRPFGSELVQDPATGLGVALPTYGVPKINANTGSVEFSPIGAAAARQQSAPREGATGTYGGKKVVYKGGKWVSAE